jgi:phosphoserine phosphatase RsbU/P
MNKDKSTSLILEILSLEGSESDYQLICKRLNDIGYNLRPTRVNDKITFESLISQNTYDIIFSDYHFPSFTALDALSLCTAICPEVPFICISAAIGEETAIELLKNGATDFIKKDHLEKLPSVVNRALAEANEKNARKEAEKKLQESERLFSLIFHSSPVGIVMTRMNDDTILEVNDAFASLFGYTREEIIGKSSPGLKMWERPSEREFMTEQLDKFGYCKDFEIIGRKKNGELCNLQLSIERISNSTSPLTFGLAYDITKRKHAEEQLLISEKKYRSLVENALIGIYTTTVDGKYLFVNEALRKMLEYDSIDEMMSSQIIKSYKVEKERGNLIENLKKLRKIFNYELQLITKNGRTIDVILNSFISGEEMTGMVYDVTATKQVEHDLKKKMHDLQRFHNLTVGREIKMIELKKEINTLLRQSGKTEKYKIVE